jgi:hypothetical protein
MSKYEDQVPSFGRLEGNMSDYVRNRAAQYAGWYDKKAIKAKRQFLWSRTIIALGAILTPFLATHDFSVSAFGLEFDLSRTLSGLIGISIASLVALEGIFKFQDQWKNYRTTEQYIITHIFMFGHGVGEYDGIDCNDGFKKFVQNIEVAIKSENEVTLNVLTRVSGVEGQRALAVEQVSK